MNQNMERRRTPARAPRRGGFVRALAQGLAAGSLLVGAVAWAAARTASAPEAGTALELPGAVASAPAGSSGVKLSYLSRLVGDVEAPAAPALSTPVTRRIAAVLRRYAKDDHVADRAAVAVVREGKKHNIDPVLIVGVMLTENAKIDPLARSSVGASGLMQVMPFHSGRWGCPSGSLVNIESNICHGVSILAKYMGGSSSLHKALLRYNGCVRGRNTPNCHTYSRKVFTNANRASGQMVALGFSGRPTRYAVPKVVTPKRSVAKRSSKSAVAKRGSPRRVATTVAPRKKLPPIRLAD